MRHFKLVVFLKNGTEPLVFNYLPDSDTCIDILKSYTNIMRNYKIIQV
jgi:hypothetical protein